MSPPNQTRLVIAALLSTALTACMVGPNYHTPSAPDTKRYTAKPLPHKTVNSRHTGKRDNTQYFVTKKKLPMEWWRLFHSKAINHLIQQGIANSPTLAAAKATLRQAEETLNATIGTNYYPSVSANVAGSRQRVNLASTGLNELPGANGKNIPILFNLYNTSVNVSYPLDIFGGQRRQVESSSAQRDYEAYELVAAYITLTSNIATTAITVASLNMQIRATHELIKADADLLQIIKKQFELGGTSYANVFSQESALAAARASLPPLEKNLAEQRHALAVLIGKLPSEAHLPTLNLDKIVLPKHLPISVPSALVEQRPDVQAAAAQLHVASANVGVATANLFPQITLSSGYGWSANAPNGLFHAPFNIWNYGAQIAQPLFNGGALRAQRRAAIAAYEQAGEQYKQSVLQAFQNVADALRAIEADAKALKAQQQNETAAYGSLQMNRAQFRLGGANYLNVLTAEQQYQQAHINRIQAQANRYTDTVALFQALGGGWWNGKSSS